VEGGGGDVVLSDVRTLKARLLTLSRVYVYNKTKTRKQHGVLKSVCVCLCLISSSHSSTVLFLLLPDSRPSANPRPPRVAGSLAPSPWYLRSSVFGKTLEAVAYSHLPHPYTHPSLGAAVCHTHTLPPWLTLMTWHVVYVQCDAVSLQRRRAVSLSTCLSQISSIQFSSVPKGVRVWTIWAICCICISVFCTLLVLVKVGGVVGLCAAPLWPGSIWLSHINQYRLLPCCRHCVNRSRCSQWV